MLVPPGFEPAASLLACSRRSGSARFFFFSFVNFSSALYYLNAWNRLPPAWQTSVTVIWASRVLGIPIPKTLVIWASPVTLTLTQIAKVIWEVDAHITRVLGMGMPKTRAWPCHCNTGALTSTKDLGTRVTGAYPTELILRRFIVFENLRFRPWKR